MKYLMMICFIFYSVFAAAAPDADCTRYMDQTYRYSVCVPDKWSKSYREGDAVNVLRLSRSDGAKITVSASRYEGENRIKWENPRRWHARTVGAGYLKVIESKEIETGGDVAIRIHVVDYRSRRGKMLQRTMLMKYGDSLLSVECRAPLKIFARHTEKFDAVMSSVDVSGDLQGEQMALLKSPERKPVPEVRKQREPKPKPRPKPEPEVIRQPQPEELKLQEPEPAPEAVPEEDKKPEAEKGRGREKAPDASVKPIEEEKPDTTKKAEHAAEPRKSSATAPKPEPVTDPATKKIMEDEQKKMQELEQSGIIDKVD